MAQQQQIVHHIVFPLNQPDRRRFFPRFVNSDEAKTEKEAVAVAFKSWNVGKDEKVEYKVEVFRE